MSADARTKAEALRLAATADDFDAWLGRAEAGSICVYARGEYLDPQCRTAARARDMAQAGIVRLNRRVVDGVGEYLAIKLAPGWTRPRVAGADALLAPGTITAMIYEILSHAAEHGHRCPTMRDIALALAMKDEDAARYQMRKLSFAGHIIIEKRGPGISPIVTICSTGMRTAAAAARSDGRIL